MAILTSYPPAYILIIGALLLPLFPSTIRKLIAIVLPILALFAIHSLPNGTLISTPFLEFELQLLRVDTLSKVFGYAFSFTAIFAFIYAWYENKATQFTAALIYIGASIGVVFSGDLISLYLFWEMMAVSSTILILSRKTAQSLAAAKRYVLVHLAGGLILLAGIVLLINETGSVLFNSLSSPSLATWLILIGFLVNAAAIPFSSWLTDAYPQSTVMGGVILSVYTSKTAIYTLLRGFSGWDILITIGCIMAIAGIVYAILENDIRRVLSFSIINQGGFMLVGAGIGTPLAIAGATAHAACCVVYTALLWMTSGAVIHQTGKSKFTELGGLFKKMPITAILAIVGALAISSFPLFSGYTTKTMVVLASEKQHLFWTWLILEIASAGAVLHAGLKYPYFVFFGESSSKLSSKLKEAPKSMLIGMIPLAIFSVYVGCSPKSLYSILPYSSTVFNIMDLYFSDIYIYHFSHVVTKMQLLLFSALSFFVLIRFLKPSNSVTLDFDWFYRKGATIFYSIIDKLFNKLNVLVNDFVFSIARSLAKTSRSFHIRILYVLIFPIRPLLSSFNMNINYQTLETSISKEKLPIGASIVGILIYLSLFLIF